MGYLTAYSLTVEVPDGYGKSKEEIIGEFRRRSEGAGYALDDYGDSDYLCKWYEAQSDLTAFSKTHPTVVFTLYGDGENSGDLWRAYVKDGEWTRAKAQITFAPNPYTPGPSDGRPSPE